jgi:dUTP pyrophosphatase
MGIMSESPSVIVFEPLFPGVVAPRRATAGAAGYDVCAHLVERLVRLCRDGAELEQSAGAQGRLSLQAGDIALVPLGFRARLPDGYEAQVRLRSSMAFRRGLLLPNAPGTIDADYPDEWLVMMKNISAREVMLEHGERIAQIIVQRFATLSWVPGVVTRSTDRTGGFGSTG